VAYLKICHVWHAYHPVIGGLELTVKHLAEAQVKLGHDVIVLTSDACSLTRSGCESINGVEVHRVKSWKLGYSDLTFPLKMPYLDIEVMHLHAQNSLFCLRAAQQGKNRGLPIVYQFLGVDYLRNHPKRLIRLLGSRYQGWIQKKALHLADRIVTPSFKDHKLLAENYDVASVVIPHGIGCEYLEKASNPYPFRDKYDIDEKKVILYIGRLDPLKGIDVLFRSLTHLRKEFNDFALIVIGTGNEEYVTSLGVLAKRLGIEHRVKLLGYVDEDLKISALDAASVLVLPSIASFETFPLVINEAWARGKPVIVSTVGALAYRVRHMENGVLTPAGDSQALAVRSVRVS
jgi:glycosyltransferase involved in cell wall biosynthesis